ncbi:MAG: DNA (cytosine-5-)-methyltransferase [Pseudanabaena sp. M090S1SP1A06QC]|jgi:DNA (cytosine-5)-methyltransferase 1|uniref:DNA (cytosine-5-)-methyltransferase n=1 Tax=Pseudanabaena mucicola TaxID=71190 RepID=UPI002576CA45|nr:DNA (cytosine-5-)-methyltransferase [Pseudanabaena mucicola]MCA6572025.1 DNA (cytosine-5-)-methyltransferase [Pseudanabaena sp. M53BS1SP1A06MG]MCA6588296.1 DNA (cytosine-5-)-methyltransferase [Pseudanabaena sp. M109S1SP1A06QC]MCA6605780.1 DNA (cytosine-5-)-methyltransferase [Pseudanabaena sp. M007S1SP1A06QC]MCA6614480.1 DNA (cytosine-5-)-methyltransferase [Pseudanabaena sp. M090S1SP1A06QC]
MPSLKFIDLFAGIGGMRLAFESAGAKCNFSSEWDKFSQLTYFANFNEQPKGDITQISSDQIPDHDILIGGFPCQPFSIAGVSKHNSLGNDHGFEHPTQGTLFFEVARIIRDKRPKAFLLENVKNLVSHDRGRTFAVIKETLEELGYYVYHQIFDAAALVPQHRERIFIVGFLEPIIFKFPTLVNKHPKIRDILEDNVDDKYTLTDNLWKYLQNYAEKHRAKGNGFGFGLVDIDGISRTLSARYYKDGSEILIPQIGKNPRRLTPRECARLMGFPETFKIVTSDTRAYKQFGNSIAVPVVQAIANEIVSAMQNQKVLTYPTRSPLQLKLFENQISYHQKTGALG